MPRTSICEQEPLELGKCFWQPILHLVDKTEMKLKTPESEKNVAFLCKGRGLPPPTPNERGSKSISGGLAGVPGVVRDMTPGIWFTPKRSKGKGLEAELPTECLRSKVRWLCGHQLILPRCEEMSELQGQP